MLAVSIGSLALVWVAAGACWTRRVTLQGTTLVAPCCWLLLSLACTAAVGPVAASGAGPAGREMLHFLAATSTFCPLMALLGAKRPQDRPWQFVVLSLWVVLALPALEGYLVRGGEPPDVRGARSWFMLLLVGLGIANFAATRFCLPALLFAAGQGLLLGRWLPGGDRLGDWAGGDSLIGGLALMAGGVLAAAVLDASGLEASGLEAEASGRGSPQPLERLWLDFRDRFGLLWALRVAERVNAAADMYHWNLVLGWRGFRGRSVDGQLLLPDDVQRPLRQNLENLLRRFVSREWIAKRMQEQIS